MNNLVKAGEVMKLKDLISYEEGSISNLAHQAMRLFSHWTEKQPSIMRAGIM